MPCAAHAASEETIDTAILIGQLAVAGARAGPEGLRLGPGHDLEPVPSRSTRAAATAGTTS